MFVPEFILSVCYVFFLLSKLIDIFYVRESFTHKTELKKSFIKLLYTYMFLLWMYPIEIQNAQLASQLRPVVKRFKFSIEIYLSPAYTK